MRIVHTSDWHAGRVWKGRDRLPELMQLFEDDVLIFDRLRSTAVSYGAATGPRIGLSFPDAIHLGLWTKPGAPFICIEPWRGVTDPAAFAGDIHEKPGIFLVAPGGTQSLRMLITV